jgi:hypothetical protein
MKTFGAWLCVVLKIGAWLCVVLKLGAWLCVVLKIGGWLCVVLKIGAWLLRYYANCVSTTLTVLILCKVESVYFFYSNPIE